MPYTNTVNFRTPETSSNPSRSTTTNGGRINFTDPEPNIPITTKIRTETPGTSGNPSNSTAFNHGKISFEDAKPNIEVKTSAKVETKTTTGYASHSSSIIHEKIDFDKPKVEVVEAVPEKVVAKTLSTQESKGFASNSKGVKVDLGELEHKITFDLKGKEVNLTDIGFSKNLGVKNNYNVKVDGRTVDIKEFKDFDFTSIKINGEPITNFMSQDMNPKYDQNTLENLASKDVNGFASRSMGMKVDLVDTRLGEYLTKINTLVESGRLDAHVAKQGWFPQWNDDEKAYSSNVMLLMRAIQDGSYQDKSPEEYLIDAHKNINEIEQAMEAKKEQMKNDSGHHASSDSTGGSSRSAGRSGFK